MPCCIVPSVADIKPLLPVLDAMKRTKRLEADLDFFLGCVRAAAARDDASSGDPLTSLWAGSPASPQHACASYPDGRVLA